MIAEKPERLIAYNLTPPTPLRTRRICLTCGVPEGYTPLVINTLEGLMEHREKCPSHFLIKESTPDRDLIQMGSGCWVENDERS